MCHLNANKGIKQYTKKRLYKTVHKRWPARTQEEDELTLGHPQSRTSSAVPRSKRWHTHAERDSSTSCWGRQAGQKTTHIGWFQPRWTYAEKTRTGFASGKGKNCLGRNRKVFSGGDGNILFLKGWKLYGHVYLPKLYGWDLCLSVCTHLTHHTRTKA